MPEQPQNPSGWLPPQAPEGRPPPQFERPAFQPPAPPAPPAVDDRPKFVSSAAPRPAAAKAGGPANTLAILSLLSGIVGLLLLVFSLGLGFFFALPCSIAAWLLGVHAKRRIADGRVASGAGQAQAGLVIGKVGVGLGVIAMVVWVALILSGFSIEGFQQDLERELERQRDSSGAQATAVPASPASAFQGAP
ncbi:MAG: DUF4190 domain-containing protein [Solirubrobacterales bacterium]|nr:DUF4190 domain-containing protein [Solirubrobacterales bacterium]